MSLMNATVAVSMLDVKASELLPHVKDKDGRLRQAEESQPALRRLRQKQPRLGLGVTRRLASRGVSSTNWCRCCRVSRRLQNRDREPTAAEGIRGHA